MIELDGVMGERSTSWQATAARWLRVGGWCPVRGHLGRIWTVLESVGDEPAGDCFLGDQQVNELVDRTVRRDSDARRS
jgi:hypothetical protein